MIPRPPSILRRELDEQEANPRAAAASPVEIQSGTDKVSDLEDFTTQPTEPAPETKEPPTV